MGVWGLAVPAVSARGEVACADGSAGPSARLTTQRVREDVLRVHDAAGTVARALGLSVPDLSATHTSIRPRPRRSGRRKAG